MQDNSLALSMIAFFGNKSPSKQQIEVMNALLFHTSLWVEVAIDPRLTRREKQCLNLSRFGFSASTTADVLKISPKTVEQHRNEAKKKLGVKTLIEAVDQGIRYGFFDALVKT